MKIETILNALQKASIEWGQSTLMTGWALDRERKMRAFRDLIIRMNAIGRAINADLCTEIDMRDMEIGRLKGLIEVLDESFDELVTENERLNTPALTPEVGHDHRR